MSVFTIDGVDYDSGLFDGEKQVLIMKRLLPTFTALIGVLPLIKEMLVPPPPEFNDDGTPKEAENTAPVLDMSMLTRVIAPVTIAMAQISDEDLTFVSNACLDVTRRRTAIGAGWVPIRQSGLIQNMDDGKFLVRLKIIWNVVAHNFSDMFEGFGVDIKSMINQANRV